MIDIRQSESYAKYLRNLGWAVERIGKTNYFIKKIPFFGSILKLQRPEKIDFYMIDKLCRKYRVFQVIIEPGLAVNIGTFSHNPLYARGFKLSKSPYLPSKTLQIDLTQSQNEIFRHLKKGARRAIRKVYNPKRMERVERGSEATIHIYSTPDEIKKWRDAWKNSVKFKRYVPPLTQLINLRKSFPHNHSLFLASHNISGRIIGGALFTTSSHEKSNYITYYWQAFTNYEGRSTLSQYSLLWYAILWAKKNGYKIFDFEGIYDERFPNRSWLGFSHFKRSFGGNEVTYPGCYTRFKLY